MNVDELVRQVIDRARQAADARAEAERERRQRRRENDHYVSGGVNWDGYGLESLIKMVAERSSPGQLNALADEWRAHGTSINQAATDLQGSLDTLMGYWSGQSASDAGQLVTTNAAWITELGTTAQSMGDPIENASGALKSAQSTMPGKPSDGWLAGMGGAGGGAAIGFAVGGPIGAAFGAAIGGIASAFGFGTSKKKLKRKAVQTMQRYETALLGVDGTTPQFGLPSDGGNPGGDGLRRPGPGVGTPGGPPVPPGSGGPGSFNPLDPGGSPRGFPWGTDPALAPPGGTAPRWQGLTGLGPNPGGGGFGNGSFPGGGSGFPGAFPPGRGLPGGGRGLPGGGRSGGAGTRGGVPAGGGRGGLGAEAERGRTGRGGVGRGGYGAGGLGAGGGRGSGQDGEHRNRVGRTGASSASGGGRGAGTGGLRGGGGRSRSGEDSEHRNRIGRDGAGAGRGAGYEAGGYGAGGLGAGGRGGSAEDAEHRNRVGRGGLAGAYGAGEDGERARGRFGRGGLEAHGASNYGAPGGAGGRKDEDEEHRRKFPVEEDPFSTDLKAAPPVIGL